MFDSSVITNDGATILAQWAGGGTLHIDKAAAGSGTVPVLNLMRSTALVQEKQTLSIITQVVGEKQTQFHLQFAPAPAPYVANQIGIWAHVDEQESKLFAIYQDDIGISIPSGSEMPEFVYAFYATIAVDNEQIVDVKVDPNACVTLSTILEYEKKLNTIVDNTKQEMTEQIEAATEQITQTATEAVETVRDDIAQAQVDVERYVNRVALPGYSTVAPTDGWESDPENNGLYHIEIEVEGISPDGNTQYFADLKQTGEEESDLPARDGWSLFTRMVAGEGTVTVYAEEPPEGEIPFRVVAMQVKEGTGSTEIMLLRRGGSGVRAANIEDAVVELDESSYTYDGSQHAPKVTSVTLRGQPLTEWEDYVYVSTPATNAGDYSVLVMGIMEYGGACYAQWKIEKAKGSISVKPEQLDIVAKLGTKMTAKVTHTGDGEISIDNASPQYCNATLFEDPTPATSNGSGSSPFDDLAPWSGMTTEVIDGNTLVKIPRYWYKWTNEGGKLKLQIAGFETEGFHVSPAHADRGDGKGERNFVYVGRYKCGSDYKSRPGVKPIVSITRATARNGIKALGAGYSQWDFAMYWTIRMLYLVEYADWDGQKVIGYGCGAGSSVGAENTGQTDAMIYHTGIKQSSRTTYGVGLQYRHIEDPWGNVLEWLDGIRFDSGAIYVFNNPADFSDTSGGVNTGRIPSTGGCISGWGIPSQSGYEWALYPNATVRNSNYDTHVADYCSAYSSNVVSFVGGYYDQHRNYGPFCFYMNAASNTNSDIGARLQYLPEGDRGPQPPSASSVNR